MYADNSKLIWNEKNVFIVKQPKHIFISRTFVADKYDGSGSNLWIYILCIFFVSCTYRLEELKYAQRIKFILYRPHVKWHKGKIKHFNLDQAAIACPD